MECVWIFPTAACPARRRNVALHACQKAQEMGAKVVADAMLSRASAEGPLCCRSAGTGQRQLARAKEKGLLQNGSFAAALFQC